MKQYSPFSASMHSHVPLLRIDAFPCVLGEPRQDRVVAPVEALPCKVVLPVLDYRVQNRLVVGPSVEDHGRTFGQVVPDLSEGPQHVPAVVGVAGLHGESDGDAQRLRQLGDPHHDLALLRMAVLRVPPHGLDDLALLRMAVLRVPPHGLVRLVSEVDEGRPVEHGVRDLRSVLGKEPPPECGDDRLLVPPQGLDGAVEAAHVELREAQVLPDRLLHHEVVAAEDAEVVAGLVRDHGLRQLREVCAPALERADDLVEAEAFEERLGPDEAADGNR